MTTAALASAVALVAAAPAGASRGNCFKTAPKHSTSFMERGRGILLKSPGGSLYGCSFDGKRAFKLQGQRHAGGFTTRIGRDHIDIEGRYAAFASVQRADDGHAAPEVFVWVVDLVTGKKRYRSQEHDSVVVGSLILKENGSVAWIHTYHLGLDDQWSRVIKIDSTTHGAEEELGQDEFSPDEPRPLIDRHSLTLVERGTAVQWTRDGETQDPQHLE